MQNFEFRPFVMERWQSIYENQVRFNLSESGVHPLTVGELLELSGTSSFNDVLLGYGQSNGTDALRANIARLYPNCTSESIVVTNGSAEANFITMWELVRPGDEMVIIVPTYMQSHGLAKNFGIAVKEVWLREDEGWQVDAAELRDAVTESTRLIVVTNPGNPTGAIMSAEARATVIEAASRSGAWILADEVYAGAELSGPETPSFFGQYDRVVATGSVSKAYGLPGLRIGWAATETGMAHRLWGRKDYLTIGPGELTDHMAAIALSPEVRPRILERTRKRLLEGWDITRQWLDDVGVFSYHPPAAGAITYARYDLPIDSADFAELLRAEYDVLIVSGEHFGMGKYLRIGYGPPAAQLRGALDRVATAIKRLQ